MSVEIVCRACSSLINASDSLELCDDGTLIHEKCSTIAHEALKLAQTTLSCKSCERTITNEDMTALDVEGDIVHKLCPMQIISSIASTTTVLNGLRK